MTLFIDSGMLIAYADIRDIYHPSSFKIFQEALDGFYGELYLSDYVFDEIVTHTLVRIKNFEKTQELAELALSSDFVMLKVDQKIFDSSWALFKQRKNLSFTDCSIVELMRSNNIKNLATFDSGFNQFKNEFNILG